MKVLFTGMGSHHCKQPANVSFFSVLADQISKFAQVIWASPSVDWTSEYLEQFDHVIFGLLPPTSISANKLYGALNVLDIMFDSSRLSIVVDSPQVWQYRNSINAVSRDYNILLGSYYSKREGFDAAARKKAMLESVSAKMSSDLWPRLLYPAVPWNSEARVRDALGFALASDMVGLNFDAQSIGTGLVNFSRADVWAAENIKSSWLSYISKSIILPIQPTKLGRTSDDAHAMDVIKGSIGILIPPQERNNLTWWNYRVVQALNSSTPIVTYWQDTGNLDHSWATLAYQVEDMSPAQRQHLSAMQRVSYINGLEAFESSSDVIKNIVVNSSKESD